MNGRITASGRRAQRGMTLIELMVAMVIGLVISIAAVAALVVARTGFTAVDSTAQLRENARFSFDLMQRVILQAGYEDWAKGLGIKEIAAAYKTATTADQDPEPDIMGFNNAVFPPTTTGFPPTGLDNNTRPTACGGVADLSCVNGSDVLIVRYQGMDKPNAVGTPDGSIINCAGMAEGAPSSATPTTVDRAWSVFHVARSAQSGEPVLMCSYRDATGAWQTRPLVQGVESFQVLYGTDSVLINASSATAAASAVVGTPDSVPDRYLNAAQIVVPGDAFATRANWRRVRSVRIGLLLRGPVGSATRTGEVKVFTPLGSTLASETDPGSSLSVVDDGRLRLSNMTFTVYLHNRIEITE